MMPLIITTITQNNPGMWDEYIRTYERTIIENKGQLKDREIILYSKIDKNLNIYLKEDGLYFVIYSNEKYNIVKYNLMSSRIKKENIVYEEELPGYRNYYLSNSQGVLFVKSYKKAIIKDIYNNIDWVLKFDEYGKFHHEFIVKKGGRVEDIKIRIENGKIRIDDNRKNIIITTELGEIKDGNLIAYQEGKEIEVKLNLSNNNEITYEVSNYDKNKDLTIDPNTLIWSTYFGGSSDDFSYSITTDANGNVYITGYTASTDFPLANPGGGAYFDNTQNGSYDAFISKFTGSTSINEKYEYTYIKDGIYLNLQKTDKPIKVIIYSIDGKLIREYNYLKSDGKLFIRTKELKNGIYIIKVYIDSREVLSLKAIKN